MGMLMDMDIFKWCDTLLLSNILGWLIPCKVEMLVDLEESNTVEPVVVTRKPVLERPTEEVGSFYKDFSILIYQRLTLPTLLCQISNVLIFYFQVDFGLIQEI